MAEIEAALLAKVQHAEGTGDQPVLRGFLRSRKKRIGTLIEATSGQTLKELKREIKRRGGKKIKVYQEINTIYAEMPVDKVTEIASVSCAQKVYDAEGDIKPCLNQSVPLVMGVEKWQLPYRFKGRKLEGQGVKVAVIDSGIDKKHPDFGWRIKRVKNFSGGRIYKGTEHGTHVAGIIAGSGKVSGYRYVGVAPKAKLYAAKVFINSDVPTTRNTIIEATLWAVKQKVDIINMSFGDNQGCSDGTCVLCKTANYAVNKGITVVAAAGNAGPGEGTISCPGNAKGVVTVGASTKTDPKMVMGFSSRGSVRQPDKPDVVAPGDKITAPQPEKQYAAMSGTSMSTPHITGIAALLYQSERHINGKNPITPAKIKHILKQGSVDLGEHSTAQGSGLANFANNMTVIRPPSKRSWLFRKKNATLPIAPQISEPVMTAFQTTPTCPAVMNQFCPHYDEQTCNTLYEACIHYQTSHQMEVLKELKVPTPLSSEDPAAEIALPHPDKRSGAPNKRGNLKGNVYGTIQHQPIAGVTVSVGGRFTESNKRGRFKLRKIGKGPYAIRILGESIYPRTAAVRKRLFGSVKVDAIEKNSAFNVQFYRELARGYHPWEKQLYPIHRWVSRKPPTIYIDTNASSTLDGKITREAVKKVRAVIIQILPVFSGGLYRKTRIKVRKFSSAKYTFDALPDNSIVISFDDKLYLHKWLGITFTEPNSFSYRPNRLNKVLIFMVNREKFYSDNHISREITAAHELGHGFGYRHTNSQTSIMDKLLVMKKFREPFSKQDQFHMKVMYSRPVGNYDIDNDPNLVEGMSVKPVGRQVFADHWATSPQPQEIIKQLQALPGLTQQLFKELNFKEL